MNNQTPTVTPPPDGLTQKEWETIRHHIDDRLAEAFEFTPNIDEIVQKLKNDGLKVVLERPMMERIKEFAKLFGAALVGGAVGAAVYKRLSSSPAAVEIETEKETNGHSRVRSIGGSRATHS